MGEAAIEYDDEDEEDDTFVDDDEGEVESEGDDLVPVPCADSPDTVSLFDVLFSNGDGAGFL